MNVVLILLIFLLKSTFSLDTVEVLENYKNALKSKNNFEILHENFTLTQCDLKILDKRDFIAKIPGFSAENMEFRDYEIVNTTETSDKIAIRYELNVGNVSMRIYFDVIDSKIYSEVYRDCFEVPILTGIIDDSKSIANSILEKLLDPNKDLSISDLLTDDYIYTDLGNLKSLKSELLEYLDFHGSKNIRIYPRKFITLQRSWTSGKSYFFEIRLTTEYLDSISVFEASLEDLKIRAEKLEWLELKYPYGHPVPPYTALIDYQYSAAIVAKNLIKKYETAIKLNSRKLFANLVAENFQVRYSWAPKDNTADEPILLNSDEYFREFARIKESRNWSRMFCSSNFINITKSGEIRFTMREWSYVVPMRAEFSKSEKKFRLTHEHRLISYQTAERRIFARKVRRNFQRILDANVVAKNSRDPRFGANVELVFERFEQDETRVELFARENQENGTVFKFDALFLNGKLVFV